MFRRVLFSLLAFLAIPLTASQQPFTSYSSGAGPSSSALNAQLSVITNQSPVSSPRVGWAYDAYPEASYEKMRGDFARMRANGATTVWIGHNNPGEVDVTKVEPGMSYAVYAALQDRKDPLYAQARAMADATFRALDAARETGLQVVLPIGYQIQMGKTWNESHPDALRVTFDGHPLVIYNSGPTASAYSPQYRRDISRYYEWVQSEIVSPYTDVITMLSLADEPMGGDYSAPAQREFEARYGVAMQDLSAAERWKIGEFQSGVIADYAAWSADAWHRINPDILTTMSFHGGETARRVWGLPDIERLFADTPDNFIISFDAYLHDDLATKPATAAEAAQLKLFLQTIGNYSRVYDKPIALWGGVNAWGLAQESSSPLDLPDAVTNLHLLHDLPARLGGQVWGIFAWNYNVKQQGLENYARPTTYDPVAMEIAVHRTLPSLAGKTLPRVDAPEIAIVVSPQEMYNELAKAHASGLPPMWFDTTPYATAFGDKRAVLVTSSRLLESLQTADSIFIASPDSTLDPATKAALKTEFDKGKIVLAVGASLAREWRVDTERWTQGLNQLPQTANVLYVLDVGF